MTGITERLETTFEYLPTYLSFQQHYQPFVGAQIAIRIDGDLVFNHATGVADLATGEPLSTEHLFRIASHSKTFTGVACMQLVEQGRLRLDDFAADHVWELAGASIEQVTVRELLAHGSGMIRDGEDSTFWDLRRPFPDRAELLAVITGEGKVLEPNEHFKYSNIGYSLLGLIIEAASGCTYREYVTRHIVTPLGLQNTGPDLDEALEHRLARGYTSRAHGEPRREIQHIDTRAESAATGFYANAADLTAYFQAHLDGDDRILTDASKRRMRQVQWSVRKDDSYGLGLMLTNVNGRSYIGHSGGYPGHITMSKLDLERRLSISVLTNALDGPAATLCTAILRLIDLALDDSLDSERLNRNALSPFTGRYASLWGVTDVADLGGRLYLLSPVLANPGDEAIELERIGDNEFKVVGDKGFRGYGEVIRYRFRDDGSVEDLRGPSGARLVPIEDFSLPDQIRRPAS